MLKINIKCLISEGLYILVQSSHQQNEIRHSKWMVELRALELRVCSIFFICEDLS